MLTGAMAHWTRPANKLSANEGFTKLCVLIKGFDIAIMHLYDIAIMHLYNISFYFILCLSITFLYSSLTW